MSALNFIRGKHVLADYVARLALRVPVLERIIASGCRHRGLRWIGFGAVAHGYSRVLHQRELRIADFGTYKFWVNVAEPLGIQPFFFGDAIAVWLTAALISEGDVCIDAGANVGHYTFLMASIVGRRGHVFAFEANVAMVEVMKQSIALNGNSAIVEVLPRALWSAADQEMTFFLSTESTNSGTSSLVDHGWFLSPNKTVRVTTTTLDEFARERSLPRLRFVKLDVERAEDHVLRGTERLLREQRIDYLVVELHTHTEAQRILEEHGYVGYLLDVPRSRLRPLADIAPETFCDALFVSPTVRNEFLSRFSNLVEVATKL